MKGKIRIVLKCNVKGSFEAHCKLLLYPTCAQGVTRSKSLRVMAGTEMIPFISMSSRYNVPHLKAIPFVSKLIIVALTQLQYRYILLGLDIIEFAKASMPCHSEQLSSLDLNIFLRCNLLINCHSRR